MNRLRLGLFFLALSAGACNRQAGTEVGNPEIAFNARFGIRDTDPTADVSALNLKVMGMGWTTLKGSDTCWDEAGGYMVNFAANGMPLNEVMVRNFEWEDADLMLHADPGFDALPVASGFAIWYNPRYAKIVKVMGADTVRALFQLPEDLRLRLRFGKATVKTWRQGEGVLADIKFDVGAWAAGLGTTPDFAFRTDGNDARYIVLSPTENAAAYETMKALLPAAFIADSTDML
jgi:hypothetical protein